MKKTSIIQLVFPNSAQHTNLVGESFNVEDRGTITCTGIDGDVLTFDSCITRPRPACLDGLDSQYTHTDWQGRQTAVILYSRYTGVRDSWTVVDIKNVTLLGNNS